MLFQKCKGNLRKNKKIETVSNCGLQGPKAKEALIYSISNKPVLP
jgi:hypothetical protein